MAIKFLNSKPDSPENEALQTLLVKEAEDYLGDIGLMFPVRLPVHLFVLYLSSTGKDIKIYKACFMVMN